MTDIEVLRQAVIDATREFACNTHGETHDALLDALDALDAAMRPDPWQLLAEYVSDAAWEDGKTWEEFCAHWVPRVKAALAWHREHPDE